MDNNFLDSVEKLYKIIISPVDSNLKNEAIRYYKNFLKIESSSGFGNMYEMTISRINKNGAVYTPPSICNYMTENLIDKEYIIKNPFLKILDPSCGCGNIIIACYKYLRKVYEENNEKLKIKDIDEHIVRYNLYGFDTDKHSLMVLSIDLFISSGYVNPDNFSQKDFLLEDNTEKYDFIIGNPPYIGHKQIDKGYMTELKKYYYSVYKDKGDISFCFLYKSIKKINDTGKIAFITSRYFLESQYGNRIRMAIISEAVLYKLIDFYGIRPFKGIGIDPVILFLESKGSGENTEIEIIKPKINYVKKWNREDKLFFESEEYINKFNVESSSLGEDSWILKDDEESKILKKIVSKCSVGLDEVCSSSQGIITGCDKAFIVDEDTIYREQLEKEILKPWIKSSYINRYSNIFESKYIIYSDLIDKEEKYINCLKHIGQYKEKLEKRRECMKGIRKWYELQWGRNQNIFEGEKIVFPYKASKNRFALDKGSFFSADVYCLIIKKGLPYNFTYEYLLCLLNSPIYNFYFKSFGKKLGEDLFEYYPNNLMKLKLPIPDKVTELSDKFLFQYFGLNTKEIKIIMEYY